MNKVILDLKYIKDLINRFEENKSLTREINTFANGQKLEIFREVSK